MAANIFIKDVDAVLDYYWDWAPLTNALTGATSDWLAGGETIASVIITADNGITIDSSSLVSDETSVVVWLSGGTINTNYRIGCRITTTEGRIDERTITIYVRER